MSSEHNFDRNISELEYLIATTICSHGQDNWHKASLARFRNACRIMENIIVKRTNDRSLKIVDQDEVDKFGLKRNIAVISPYDDQEVKDLK